MQKPLPKKGIVFAVIVLFIGMIITPSTGHMASFDDNTPPITTCTLSPSVPDGYNGWYVSDVEVTLNAIDDLSGVNATYYRINEEGWETYVEPFTIISDGHCLIEYYSVDNAGNEEDVKSFVIKIDQTIPKISLYLEPYKKRFKWYVTFTAICSDETSGMDRVEFYINEGLVSTDDKEPYEWTFEWSDVFQYVTFKAVAFDKAGNSDYDDYPRLASSAIGFICNPKVTNQSVTFFAIIVSYTYQCDCGLPTGEICLFKRFTIPNNYKGRIGRFFIDVTFYE